MGPISRWIDNSRVARAGLIFYKAYLPAISLRADSFACWFKPARQDRESKIIKEFENADFISPLMLELEFLPNVAPRRRRRSVVRGPGCGCHLTYGRRRSLALA